MSYRIVLSRAAEKDLRRIRSRSALRLLARAIEALADNPFPPQSRKLQGAGEIWRVRVGNWRICYSVDSGRLIVLVLTAAQRGNVYERLRRRLG